jgi:RNA-directed DNA polymerase
VRTNGLTSASAETKRKIKYFDENWINNLARLRRHLKAGSFDFVGEVGIAPLKGKGKRGRRPLVIAPVENRIVRRAILEVLQGYGDGTSKPRRQWPGIPAVREVMNTETSVGGIRHRGVPHALALIDQAVREGSHFFARSDIKNFFTRIPIKGVVDFIHGAVDDHQFATLFEKALATNLTNKQELEERRLFILFPDSETGVAQGSALSALAGNIALRRFDAELNGRGILCVRYIDDFVLLETSEQKIRAAYSSAREKLKQMGMDVYDLNDPQARKDGKVDVGNIYSGTDVLGYRISGGSRQPSATACKTLLYKLDRIVEDGRREMAAAARGAPSSHLARFHQTMTLLHRTIWGWSQSFRHATAKHVFDSLDRKIDMRIETLEKEAHELIAFGSADVRRRVMGVHLLADTELRPLPEITQSRKAELEAAA